MDQTLSQHQNMPQLTILPYPGSNKYLETFQYGGKSCLRLSNMFVWYLVLFNVVYDKDKKFF